MFTMVQEIIFSLMISIFSPPMTTGQPIVEQGSINDVVEEPERGVFCRPTEALGGGYKRY